MIIRILMKPTVFYHLIRIDTQNYGSGFAELFDLHDQVDSYYEKYLDTLHISNNIHNKNDILKGFSTNSHVNFSRKRELQFYKLYEKIKSNEKKYIIKNEEHVRCYTHLLPSLTNIIIFYIYDE